MTLIGNEVARGAFDSAVAGGSLHHAWLFAGPEGVGKASFADQAARRLIAGGADPRATDAQIDAGAHPRFRVLRRLPKDADKPENGVARSITIDQVRSLQSLFGLTVEPGERRVVIIDAIDDLERPSANALLKSLEEPPIGTVFLLISHAPGRLLPTIRSRCRVLRFSLLSDADVAAVLLSQLPDASPAEIDALVRSGAGSPGRALAFAGLDMAVIEQELAQIADTGDRDNAIRSRLAKALSGKAAQPRLAAFIERVPSFIAERARDAAGERLRIALDAHVDAREIGGISLGLSQDAAGTVFELGGVVARLGR